MDFGLVSMGYHGRWDDVAFAEQHGFPTAGFVDSPLVAGDPYVGGPAVLEEYLAGREGA